MHPQASMPLFLSRPCVTFAYLTDYIISYLGDGLVELCKMLLLNVFFNVFFDEYSLTMRAGRILPFWFFLAGFYIIYKIPRLFWLRAISQTFLRFEFVQFTNNKQVLLKLQIDLILFHDFFCWFPFTNQPKVYNLQVLLLLHKNTQSCR